MKIGSIASLAINILSINVDLYSMGWSFRKRVKLGPVNINFSKSGVGGSVGVKGARIGVDARGRKYTHLSIPNTGIYSREYHNQSKRRISLDDADYDVKKINGKGKALNITILAMFLFIWFAGESLFFALLITVPAYLFVLFTQGDELYDYYQYSGNEDSEIDRLEAELAQLEELEQMGIDNPFAYFDLTESCTREMLNKAFKQKIKKYHPDAVASLGPELQDLAEKKSKEILEMYEKCVEILRRNQAS